MTVATPKPGTDIRVPIPGMSYVADCAGCGGRIRTARKGGDRWWQHVRGGAVECPGATREGAGEGAAPEPRRDALGFPIVGEYMRLTRLREGGWRGAFDWKSGRPVGADQLGDMSHPDVRRSALRDDHGYRGALGPAGYPVAAGPTGEDPSGLKAVRLGPLEVGGVYVRRGTALRVVAIDYGDADTISPAVYAEDSDGHITSWIDWHDADDPPRTLFSPSHPDDPEAHAAAWRRLDPQTPADPPGSGTGQTHQEGGRVKFFPHGASEPIEVSDEEFDRLVDQETDVVRQLKREQRERDADMRAATGPATTTTTKGTSRMSNNTAATAGTGEVTSHETAIYALGALWTKLGTLVPEVETTVNGLQASGIAGETVTALYAVLEAVNTAHTQAKTAYDTYMRTQNPLAEAVSAAGANAAGTTGFYRS